MKLYDRRRIDWNRLLFDDRALFWLLLPIVIEQLLNSLMGMVDTMMVSTVGGTALSAVALVDAVNNLVIQIFSAMAAGAAIVCSRYIGHGDQKESNRAAGQVLLLALAVSLCITAVCLLGGKRLLRLIFGAVEDAVMQNALTYFAITALSYPFLALFSSGAALCRAAGDARFPTKISALSNLINVAANAALIYGLRWGVAGAATATLLSRAFCALVVLAGLRRPRRIITVRNYARIRPDRAILLQIMAIGIPAGIENGMFQFGKLAIQSTVSTLGTVAISAQAMTDIFELINGMFSNSVGIGLMTVVGQCIGAGRDEEARYYIVRLMRVAWIGVTVSCLAVFAIAKPVTLLSGMVPEAAALCFRLVAAMTFVKPLVWVGAFGLPYAFRAAGDARFSMTVSVLSMWGCRVALCILLVRGLHLGLAGVWIGMFADWIVRAGIFARRFLSGKWLHREAIASQPARGGRPSPPL